MRQEQDISLPTPARISCKSYKYDAPRTKKMMIEIITYCIHGDEVVDQKSWMWCSS